MTAKQQSWESHLRRNWKRLAKYPPELLRPLPPLNKEDWKDPLKIEQRTTELKRRTELLAIHFGITSGDPYDLLTALTYVHVPGFREAKAPSGPKVAWNDWNRAELLAAFDIEAERDRYANDPEIADKLAQRKEWATRLKRAVTPKGKSRALLAHIKAARTSQSDPQFLRAYQYARTVAECRRKLTKWEWTDSRISIEQFESTARELGYDLNLRAETTSGWFPEFARRIRAIEQTRT